MRVKVDPAGEDGALARLQHGQFFGQFQNEVEVGGFSLALVRADPRRDVQRHTHEAAHFIFVTRGIYASSAQSAGSADAAPLLIYNPPDTTHRDRFRRGGDGGFDGRFLSVSIAPERMKTIAEAVALTDRSVAVTSPSATALTTRLVAELRDWEPSSPLAVEGLCLELIAAVARREPFSGTRPPRWLLLARELLHDGSPRSVSDIAAMCGVHPVHLARAFRRFFGCSPRAFLERCRVERAAALLRRLDVNLAEVALRSGFADQSHMTHAFRRVLDTTPAALRRLDGDNDVASGQDSGRRQA